jgi:hypothetical protein
MVNMERQPRDQVVGVRFTASELRELERLATRERMTLSSVIRGATLSHLALQLNPVAWRALGESVRELLRQKFGSVVDFPEEEGATRAK